MKKVSIVERSSHVTDAVKLILKRGRAGTHSRAVSFILNAEPYSPTLGWLERVFWLIDRITTYRLDKAGREQIKDPDVFIYTDKAGDCDDYAVLWVALLERVGLTYQVVIVDYEDDNRWDHVYVTTPGPGGTYITLDNVVGKFRRRFNLEVGYKDKEVFRDPDTVQLSARNRGGHVRGIPLELHQLGSISVHELRETANPHRIPIR